MHSLVIWDWFGLSLNEKGGMHYGWSVGCGLRCDVMLEESWYRWSIWDDRSSSCLAAFRSSAHYQSREGFFLILFAVLYFAVWMNLTTHDDWLSDWLTDWYDMTCDRNTDWMLLACLIHYVIWICYRRLYDRGNTEFDSIHFLYDSIRFLLFDSIQFSPIRFESDPILIRSGFVRCFVLLFIYAWCACILVSNRIE